jgi:hypothetical protein
MFCKQKKEINKEPDKKSNKKSDKKPDKKSDKKSDKKPDKKSDKESNNELTNDYIIKKVKKLSKNFKKPIPKKKLKKYKFLDWGNNGIGNRWAKKNFNYAVIYKNKKTKIYSENDECLKKFEKEIEKVCKNSKQNGIVAIIPLSITKNKKSKRPISKKISNMLKNEKCIVCSSKNDIIIDHKNDFYNNKRVLSIKTQKLDDFQPLCNHCNLQKRQICKDEIYYKKLHSIKDIPQFKAIDFVIPWEKKIFNLNDKNCKKDTYWYDPVEYVRKFVIYIKLQSINYEIRKKIKIIN